MSNPVDEDEMRRRAWEATSRLHREPMGPNGRMVTDQGLLVEAMISFAVGETSRVVAHLADCWGVTLPTA